MRERGTPLDPAAEAHPHDGVRPAAVRVDGADAGGARPDAVRPDGTHPAVVRFDAADLGSGRLGGGLLEQVRLEDVRLGPVPLPSGGGTGPTPADGPVTSGAGRSAVPGLLALRPFLAGRGLGLGVAGADDPAARPAGPAERAATSGMPDGRRREFLAGRLAARRALSAVGLDCGEIPRHGRAPVFPPGRAASLTHSGGLAVAVARAPGRPGPVGCDLELRPLPGAAARLVLCADEERLLRAAGPAEHLGDRLTVLFSAKEAAWKALCGPAAHDGRDRADAGETRVGPAGRGAGEADSGPRRTPPAPARPAATLRDLRAVPLGDRLRVLCRAAPRYAVDVCVVRVGGGVFSWVLGPATGAADPAGPAA